MTKDRRDYRKWSNPEIEADTPGYLEAQKNYREDQDAAERERVEADDERRWTEQFVAEGGRESDAAAAYRALRNQQAADAAADADRAAREVSRSAIRNLL